MQTKEPIKCETVSRSSLSVFYSHENTFLMELVMRGLNLLTFCLFTDPNAERTINCKGKNSHFSLFQAYIVSFGIGTVWQVLNSQEGAGNLYRALKVHNI